MEVDGHRAPAGIVVELVQPARQHTRSTTLNESVDESAILKKDLRVKAFALGGAPRRIEATTRPLSLEDLWPPQRAELFRQRGRGLQESTSLASLMLFASSSGAQTTAATGGDVDSAASLQASSAASRQFPSRSSLTTGWDDTQGSARLREPRNWHS